MSIEFTWNPEDFESLLKASIYDDAINLSLKYMVTKDVKILEAGCGGGRVVKYLHNLGYHDVHGIELNTSAVENIKTIFPELDVIQGDILKMPYDPSTFDVVLSYGVVEHFPAGLELPLRKHFELLKPNGIAIITVPCLNKLRRIIDLLDLEVFGRNGIRHLLKYGKLPKKNKDNYMYYVYPKFGNFFEYRLTPVEFEDACVKAGFEIIESVPICHDDGLFHTFGRILVTFKDNIFHVNPLGRILNRILKAVPFCHNHMHACVLRRAS